MQRGNGSGQHMIPTPKHNAALELGHRGSLNNPYDGLITAIERA